MVARTDGGLSGRRLYLPRMTDCGSQALAAAFRSAGIDAVVLPPPDLRTLELGAAHLGGEECLPAKVTLGDILKVVAQPGFDPRAAAFMIPTTEGPCRFGQYAPSVRLVLRSLGYSEIPILSPTSGDGYQAMGPAGPDLARTAWRAIVASDILRKLLLKTRPSERVIGAAEAAYASSLADLCEVLACPGVPHGRRLAALGETLLRTRARFRAIPTAGAEERLLIAVQGEIFCRMEEFSNDRLIRRLEAFGAEAWLADIAGWVWYCNVDQEENLRHAGRGWSRAMLGARIRDRLQRADETALRALFVEDFAGYEDPEDIRDVLAAGARSLPRTGAAGEMVLSVGAVEHYFRRGVDGILDVSPFSCMNGIVSEALYPRQSAEHAGLPIRTLYVDGTDRDLDQELEIFLELAQSYRRAKPVPRPTPRPRG
jgi:predicted nucleotide-binding protein (sugar kinase/HSP70/actin superfamily)